MGTLYVLLWKDLLIAKRRKISVIYRMTFPWLIMFQVLFIRSKTGAEEDKFLDDETTAPRCILYTPNTSLAGTLMDEVGRQLGLSRLTALPHTSPCIGYHPFSSYSEIAELVKTFHGHEAVIIFKDMDAASWSSRRHDTLSYSIQMFNKFNTSSFTSTDVFLSPDHPHYGDIYDDFMHIQWAINTSYIKVRTGQYDPQKLSVQEFPHFRDNVDEALSLEKTVISIIYTYVTVLSGVNLYTYIMTRMMCERAAGIQELIKINGVSPTTMGIAYFISSIPPALSFCVGLSITMQIGNRPIIEYTSGIYTFVGLALYAVSLIAFGMACSYVVNKSRFALVISLFFYIATVVLIKLVVQYIPKNYLLIMLSGMVVHVPLLWMFHEIFIFEALKKPLTMSDLNSKLNAKGSVLEAYICLILQSSIYFALTWYLSHVRQGKYGNSLPWNFPCKKQLDASAIIVQRTYKEVIEERDNRYFEEPPEGMQVGIKIINVSKYYPKPALSDVYLDVYKGEITVLLGHNGAGKTTLMSIIIGMTRASQGKVLVNELETASHILQVRRLIGFCPQHNLFINDINVIEHVMFFNMLKGKSKDHRATSQELLNKLGIGDEAFTDPEELCGGMKRRLQLACALAGGSDVLVLDEPTSGLDVKTRRELWNLLLSLRGERTVLLSTHFMEEADALGDRIAALHTGHLRCHATPMFLKRAMGGGYRLSLVTSGKPNEAEITAVVTQHASTATVREESLNSITYNLPSTATPQFPALFTALETDRSALEIVYIGVGVSTMEEVFLFLCSDSEIFIKEETDIEVPASEYGKITGKALYKRQAIVLFKRHLNFIRDSLLTFSILALYTTVYRHANTVALNLFHKVTASQFLVAGERDITTYDETAVDLPLPPPNGAKSAHYCVFWAVLVGCVILFTSYNLQALPARDSATGARHLHVMAGCPAALHWLCSLAFHTALTLLTLVPITIISACVNDTDDTFSDVPFLLTLILILILGNIAFFGLMYFLVISFEKKRSSALVIFIILWSACISILKMFADILGTKMNQGEQLVVDLSNTLPPFSMMYSMAQAAYVARLNALCELHKNRCPDILLEDKGFDEEKCCASSGESKSNISLEEFAPGAQVLVLLVQGIVYMTLVILVQMGYVNCVCDRLFNIMFTPKPMTHVDELVAAEAKHVDEEIKLRQHHIVNHHNAMLVSHLHKNYAGFFKKRHAVKGICFSVKKGECFGLLGLNGAGKSTTLKMMTSEVCPTSGCIFANGVFLHKQKKKFLHNIGYCPQFLGFDNFLTSSDNLKTLLTIRGLDDKDIDKEVKAWIAVVGLQKYANMRASSYSGGYKRRLAAATALSSGAPLSLLDEPTAGVDVGARRLVYAALKKALSLGDSIVITSHSMNEIEALCARIAILSAGKIRALGTPAELRTKYAQGYALTLKIKASYDVPRYSGGKSAVDKLKEAVAALFVCVLKDEHKTMLHYHIKDKMNYSDIFINLESLRELFSDVIEDYSVNETTLEEVFLYLAKEHLLENQAAEEAALEEKRNKYNP